MSVLVPTLYISSVLCTIICRYMSRLSRRRSVECLSFQSLEVASEHRIVCAVKRKKLKKEKKEKKEEERNEMLIMLPMRSAVVSRANTPLYKPG